MKKLGVCGDSYFASISYDPNNLDNGYGKHFTEILAEKLGWEVITFARGACGNQTIRLQIDEIIKLKPDLVIVGTTSPDRFEYPINDLKTEKYVDKFTDLLHEVSYKENEGLTNIEYLDCPDKSSEQFIFKNKKPVLFADTLNNIFQNNRYLKKNEIQILEKWYDRFYDFQWKKQTDTWIISDGLRKLMDNDINFFCINRFLYENQLSFYGNKIIKVDSPLNPSNYNSVNENVPYRFHTTLKSQEILADLWLKHINENYGK
jgi:hypothetical protein